jgi:ABC-2 type transport system permease protein
VILAIIKCRFLTLLRDRVSLLLVFVLPIIFYAIFAGIFGSMGDGGKIGTGILALIVDQDDTPQSRALTKALKQAGNGLRVSTTWTKNDVSHPWTLERARKRVMQSDAEAAIVLPKGMGISFTGDHLPVVQVLVDPSNPIARTMVPGLLQQAAMIGMRSDMIRSGMNQLEFWSGELTPKQREAMDRIETLMSQETDTDGETTEASGAANTQGTLLPVNVEDAAARDTGGAARSMTVYYAAGIGVMFLLFSLAGASGAILDDKDAGILDRMFFTPLGISRLIIANWIWLTILAVNSMFILFLFATLVFEFGPWTWPRLIAWLVLTTIASSAAAALAMLLAAICTTRAQLAGISTIVILAMSAVGGSMIPRFIMPPAILDISWYVSFNAWAVEGYLDIFWYTPQEAIFATIFSRLAPILGVLIGMTVVFLIIARLLARRWEQA